MADAINAVIDLSHHNGNVDLGKAAAASIAGVIHKATQGTSFSDNMYTTNRSKASAAGLLWGAYHFGDGSDAAAQADHFLNVVKPDADTLLVLDFEENTQGPSMTLEAARTFVTRVNDATGRFPGLYGGVFLKQALGKNHDPVLANCWLWLSQFGNTPVVPANWPTWTMWQYTDGAVGPQPHTVDGVGPCDRDKFNGDLDALGKLWKASSAAAEGVADAEEGVA